MKYNLLSQNSKLKKTSKINGMKIFNFGIPAVETCIGATTCKTYCYAKKGAYAWPVVKAAYNRRLVASKQDDFCEVLFNEIVMSQATHIRIHDSGDFYSREYLNKWLTVADSLPHVTFYCYTKSVPLFLGSKLPSNFKAVFSFGGRYDHLIDTEKHAHCKVFDTKMPSNYIDATNDDLLVLSGKNIGLIKH